MHLSLPKVSIICPLYNASRFLPGLASSIIKQTEKNWELILVDDCSDDNSVQIAESFVKSDERIRLLKLAAKAGGPAGPRNLGIQSAKAELIAFIDVDDRWHPEKLSSVLAYANDYDLISHNLRCEFTDGSHGRIIRSKSFFFNPPLAQLLLGNHLLLSTVVVRSSLLFQVNGFDDNKLLKGVEDYDLWLRLLQLQPRYKRIDVVLGTYWIGGGNISSNACRMTENLKFVYSRHASRYGFFLRLLIGLRLAFSIARLNIHSADNNPTHYIAKPFWRPKIFFKLLFKVAANPNQILRFALQQPQEF